MSARGGNDDLDARVASATFSMIAEGLSAELERDCGEQPECVWRFDLLHVWIARAHKVRRRCPHAAVELVMSIEKHRQEAKHECSCTGCRRGGAADAVR